MFCAYTRPTYQVSVYRTIGPLVHQIIFILAGNENMHKSLNELEFGQIPPLITELSAFERLKN